MAGNVVELNDSNFDTEISSADGPVLVDFWAPWCGPCRMLSPSIEALADEYQGKAKVVKVNTDDARQTAMKFGISSIPALFIMKDGEIVDRMMGAVPKERLAAALDKQLA